VIQYPVLNLVQNSKTYRMTGVVQSAGQTNHFSNVIDKKNIFLSFLYATVH